MPLVVPSDIPDDFDFGEDDGKISKKDNKKRKHVDSKPKSRDAKNQKRRKKSSTYFEMDVGKSLEKQIQEWIDREWKGHSWQKNKGVQAREIAREMLQEAFSAVQDENNVNDIVLCVEQTVYEKWFIFYFEKYARMIRTLCKFISDEPKRFLSNRKKGFKVIAFRYRSLLLCNHVG